RNTPFPGPVKLSRPSKTRPTIPIKRQSTPPRNTPSPPRTLLRSNEHPRHDSSCHVRRGSPDPAVRPTGGLQVTRRRSGTGRPAVAEDGRVRRPCPNQRNKSERKENTSQPQLCGTPGPLPASGTMIRTDRGARRPTRSDQRAEGPAHRRTHG